VKRSWRIAAVVLVWCLGSTVASAADAPSGNPIVPEGAKLELLHTRQAKLNSGLTEGPAVARDGSIYAAGNLLACDGADGGGRCIRRWNLKTAQSEVLADRFQGKRFNSPNDLCLDLQGRIYFTDPRYGGAEPRELPNEAVYRLEKDGTVIKIADDVEKPNGLALSPDQHTLYLADHNNGGNRLSPTDPEPKRGAMKVYAFPLDRNGLVSGPRSTLVDFGKENGCDGMRVDRQGNLYLAVRSLARPGILIIDATGKDLAFIPTGPTNQSGLFEDWKGIPSNVEFGIGGDSNVLYITIDKSLYRIRLKTRGFHAHLAEK
jgi:gluconolactonase